MKTQNKLQNALNNFPEFQKIEQHTVFLKCQQYNILIQTKHRVQCIFFLHHKSLPICNFHMKKPIDCNNITFINKCYLKLPIC